MNAERSGDAHVLRLDRVGLSVIALLLVVLYAKIAVKLVADWYNLPDFSHGFLVPLFVGYLVYDRRARIAATSIQPTWWGLPLVLLGLATLMLGTYGADLFLSRLSFVLLVTGILWMLLGAPLLRVLRFPLCIMLLGIPLPAVVFNEVTFPLQLLASQVASSILPMVGVPVLREGNVMQLASMKLEVAEACSGIRSLLSLFTVAILYGSLFERSILRRSLLALASVPIAVAANSARIVGTGLCVQYWDPEKALGFFHEFSGWLMFLLSMGLLYLVHQILERFLPDRPRTTQATPQKATV